MRTPVYLFGIEALGTTEAAIKTAIESEVSLGNRRRPVFYGVDRAPDGGSVRATWILRGRIVDPDARARALLAQLETLVTRLERENISATLRTNFRKG